MQRSTEQHYGRCTGCWLSEIAATTKRTTPQPSPKPETVQAWWQAHYLDWIAQLKTTIVHYRNVNHPWQFSPEQQQVLQRYYDANQLLLDCLHSNCEVMPTIRQEIETTLLLPQKELEDHEWQ